MKKVRKLGGEKDARTLRCSRHVQLRELRLPHSDTLTQTLHTRVLHGLYNNYCILASRPEADRRDRETAPLIN